MVDRIRLHPLWIRYSRWEFWPGWLMYGPVLVIWLAQALRAGRLFFFSAVNPAIPTGGWVGESKGDILRRIPEPFVPPTLFLPAGSEPEFVPDRLREAGIDYPLIAKPDVGERGFLVEVIANEGELLAYLARTQVDLLLQAFIDYPLEISALCYRVPGTGEAGVTSLCTKDFLSVTGDGRSTLGELVGRDPRAILQRKKLREQYEDEWEEILPEGVEWQLEPIGNHCRGTRFVDARHLIDPALEKVLLGLLDRMEGIQYGRFDLRARSVEDLRQGRHFQVFEFNGVGSDPAHLYDARHSIPTVYRVIWAHFSIMRHIYRQQRAKGIRAMGFGEAWRAYRDHRSYKRRAGAERIQTPDLAGRMEEAVN